MLSVWCFLVFSSCGDGSRTRYGREQVGRWGGEQIFGRRNEKRSQKRSGQAKCCIDPSISRNFRLFSAITAQIHLICLFPEKKATYVENKWRDAVILELAPASIRNSWIKAVIQNGINKKRSNRRVQLLKAMPAASETTESPVIGRPQERLGKSLGHRPISREYRPSGRSDSARSGRRRSRRRRLRCRARRIVRGRRSACADRRAGRRSDGPVRRRCGR